MEQDKKSIAKNIQQQARASRILFIWTDCDREGEHIGSEVRKQAFMGNRRLEVKRAKFSNTERAWVKVHSPLSLSSDFCSHVIHAAQHPIDLDDRQANAVAARIELDLRIGAAFTRLQTLQLQNLGEALHDRILSYGIMTQQFNPCEQLLN
jgi:DNA topoisomerase-3